MYHIGENFGGTKIWRIYPNLILATKNLANCCTANNYNHHTYYYHTHNSRVFIYYACLDMATYSFTVNAMVQGYHIYSSIWNASISEILPCTREDSNRRDTFAVCVVKPTVGTVGHLPRLIVCSLFHLHKERRHNYL